MTPGAQPGEETSERIRRSYDATPYPRGSYAQAAPAHMGMIAALLGVPAAEPATARVLEVGCAEGGNMIPLAVANPGMQITAFDLSGQQIAAASAAASACGLDNVRFLQADIRDPGIEGSFDYVIAHGILSWVPPDVREALFQLIGRVLAQAGVAYVSFNARPGFDRARVVRDAMLYHAGHIADPAERARTASQFAEWMAASIPEGAGHADVFRVYVDELRSRQSEWAEGALAFMLHDELAEVNDGFYLKDVAAAAEGYGLAFLADGDGPPLAPEMPAGVLRRIAEMSSGVVEAEQYIDFLTGRVFRRALFCRAETRVERPLLPELRRFSRLWASTAARPDAPAAAGAPVRFAVRGGADIATDHPASIATLTALVEAGAAGLPVADLLPGALAAAGASIHDETAVRGVLGMLVRGAYSRDLVEFRLGPAAFATTLPDRPAASPYARYLAARGQHVVTNLKHQRVALHPAAAALLTLLDGSRDLDALVAGFTAWLAGPPAPGTPIRDRIATTLRTFAEDALLLPD